MRAFLLTAALVALFPSGLAAQERENLHEGFMVNRAEDQIVLRWSHPGRSEARFKVLACSPRDNRIAVELSPGLIAVWDPERDLIPVFLQASPKGVQALAFSADGTLLATADAEKLLCLWNVKTGEKQKQIKLPAAGVKGLAFSPDGKSLVVGHSRVEVYDLATGRTAGNFHKEALSGVNSLAVSPDGRYLAVGGRLKVHLLDMERGNEVALDGSHPAAIGALAFSPDGRWLASGGADRQIVLWAMKERKAVRFLRGAHVEAISALVFTRDGKRLLSGNGPRKGAQKEGVETGYTSDVKVWDVAKGTAIDTLVGHRPFGIQALGMTGDGRTAVSTGTGNDKTLRLWDLAALDAPPRPFGGGKARARALDLTRDGQWLITHPGNKQLVFWDPRSGKRLKQLDLETSLYRFVVSADKQFLYGRSLARSIVKIDLETGKTLTAFPTSDIVPGDLALSPDGRFLAAGSGGGSVRVLDPQTGKLRFELRGGIASGTHSVKFAPGSDLLAASGNTPLIRLWNTSKGAVVRDINMPATARVVTLSPDGRRALAGFQSWPLRLFDVETGEEVRQYDGGASGTAVLALAYSPDGKKILAGGPNLALQNSRRVLVDSLILLDADSGRVLGRWRSEPGDVYRILFSRDGNQAFYTCDGILKVLNLKEGS